MLFAGHWEVWLQGDVVAGSQGYGEGGRQGKSLQVALDEVHGDGKLSSIQTAIFIDVRQVPVCGSIETYNSNSRGTT